MKATELMIGDWVYRPDCEDRVTTILGHSIYGLDRLRGTICEEELKPIPLTAEILEKNGFEFTDHIEDNYGEWKNRLKLIEVSDGFYAFNGGIHIVFAHQLQHTLRLCGLTELADNFTF